MVDIGQQAPDFTLPSHKGEDVSLNQYRGQKNVVLSFHVLAFTRFCTEQVAAFGQETSRFEEQGTQVLGISVDSAPVQQAFCEGLGNIPYPLLADFHPKGEVSKHYGVYNEQQGTSLRAVFVIDRGGVVRFKHIYTRGIPNPEEILKEVESLAQLV